MKAVGSLLVMLSLVAGSYAAATAYLVPIDAIDPQGPPATLHAPAGRSGGDPATPILRPGPRESPLVLTAAHLEALRSAGVERVHLKEFSFARWKEGPVFLLAAAGLLVGSLMVRSSIRRTAAVAVREGGAAARPEALLDAAIERARRLRDELEGVPASPAPLGRLAACVEAMQSESFDPFVERRTALVAELGMGGYAQLMDRFAAAERQFNRAWSAAADAVPAEATACFGEGIALLEQARSRLAPPASTHRATPTLRP